MDWPCNLPFLTATLLPTSQATKPEDSTKAARTQSGRWLQAWPDAVAPGVAL